MRPVAGALLFMACAMSGCSLSFGPVGAWSTDTPPPISLTGSTAVAMPDGEVVFLGGLDSREHPLDRVLRFEPQDRSWSLGAPVPVQGGGYAIVALPSSSLLIAGGFGSDSGSLLASTWLYSPKLNAWQQSGNLHVPRTDGAAVLLTDGRVLITGGTTPLATPIQLPDGTTENVGFGNSAEIFDPLTNSWTLVGSIQVARVGMALVALPHGKALAAGGCAFTDQDQTFGNAMGSAEVFDPATGAWALTSPLPGPRCGAGGVLLRDGRALVTGGSLSNFPDDSVTDAVLYDEQNRDWIAAGSTVPGGSAPILLSDGEVFVAAVQPGTPKGGLETETVGGKLFDPSSGDWTYATSTSIRVSFRVGLEQVPPLVEETGGSALVLLWTADLVFTFDPTGEPPPVLILDSSGLSLILAGLAAALCLWLAIHYVRNRVHHDVGRRST